MAETVKTLTPDYEPAALKRDQAKLAAIDASLRAARRGKPCT